MKILFLTKKGNSVASPYIEEAISYILQIFPNTKILRLSKEDSLPKERVDVLISFLCPKIFTQDELNLAKSFALNLHPATPDYPGTGCSNFALYEGAKVFGATMHHMSAQVDSGEIIGVRRFRILEKDDLLSITKKAYSCMMSLFYELCEHLCTGAVPEGGGESWSGRKRTRAQLDALCVITPQMSESELNRRIKATTFDKAYACTFIHGRRFVLEQ